jgi:ribonuclease HI
MLFKRNIKVYVPVDENLSPIEENGLVRFVYSLKEGSPAYTGKRSNFTYIEGAVPESADKPVPEPAKTSKTKSSSREAKPHKERLEPPECPGPDPTIPPGTIVAYTDGGASPNPGPAGLGAILLFGQHTLELWEFFERATNNYCELTAILRVLQRIRNPEMPVIIYSDSAYAIGVLTGTMNAKQNLDLVNQIQEEMRRFPRLQLKKVRAHIGHVYNEHVDHLCGLARDTRSGGERRN